jgi:putative flavoprotein involved in K+ transport
MGEAGQVEARAERTNDSGVAIIGAGQAGLAMGYFLRQKGIPFFILERGDSIGSAWRER